MLAVSRIGYSEAAKVDQYLALGGFPRKRFRANEADNGAAELCSSATCSQKQAHRLDVVATVQGEEQPRRPDDSVSGEALGGASKDGGQAS